jgi:hypothetical protein
VLPAAASNRIATTREAFRRVKKCKQKISPVRVPISLSASGLADRVTALAGRGMGRRHFISFYRIYFVVTFCGASFVCFILSLLANMPEGHICSLDGNDIRLNDMADGEGSPSRVRAAPGAGAKDRPDKTDGTGRRFKIWG